MERKLLNQNRYQDEYPHRNQVQTQSQSTLAHDDDSLAQFAALNGFYQSHIEDTHGLKRMLVCTALELEAIHSAATQEIMEHQQHVDRLQNLLYVTCQERDQARDECQRLKEELLQMAFTDFDSGLPHYLQTDSHSHSHSPATTATAGTGTCFKADSGVTECDSLLGTPSGHNTSSPIPDVQDLSMFGMLQNFYVDLPEEFLQSSFPAQNIHPAGLMPPFAYGTSTNNSDCVRSGQELPVQLKCLHNSVFSRSDQNDHFEDLSHNGLHSSFNANPGRDVHYQDQNIVESSPNMEDICNTDSNIVSDNQRGLTLLHYCPSNNQIKDHSDLGKEADDEHCPQKSHPQKQNSPNSENWRYNITSRIGEDAGETLLQVLGSTAEEQAQQSDATTDTEMGKGKSLATSASVSTSKSKLTGKRPRSDHQNSKIRLRKMVSSHVRCVYLPEPPEADPQVMLKYLPERGKLVEAVEKAGPLLQTLLLSNPIYGG